VQAVGLWLLAAASAVTVGQRFAVVYQQAAKVANAPLGGMPVTRNGSATAADKT
jgi:hypothetical protein